MRELEPAQDVEEGAWPFGIAKLSRRARRQRTTGAESHSDFWRLKRGFVSTIVSSSRCDHHGSTRRMKLATKLGRASWPRVACLKAPSPGQKGGGAHGDALWESVNHMVGMVADIAMAGVASWRKS